MIEPARPGDEVPEADLIERHTPIEDTDVDTGTDGADQLEQTITVPLPEEDYPRPELDR